MLLLFTMLVTTGCGKLSERKFDMALRGTGMKSVVQTTEKEGIYPGIKFWKYAGSSSENKLQLQYIVFDSEKDAETFADSQKQYQMAFIKCQYTDDYLLTCVQLGISIADLDLLTIGLVNDMFTERQNDGYSYKELASQSDFDRF